MIAVYHETLVNFMKTNFLLTRHHHYSYSDIENMLPWERLVYVDMVGKKLQEEAMEAVDSANAQKDMMSLLNKQRMLAAQKVKK